MSGSPFVRSRHEMTATAATRTDSADRCDIWRVQRYGLLALIVLNFFPIAHGPTRYLFFSLLAVLLVQLWRQRAPLWVSTSIDVPLLGLLAWILATIPFSIDSAYSFREWRKLGAQVLLFYWTVRVVHGQGDRRLVQQVLLAVVGGTAVCAGFALVEFVLHGGTWRGRDVRAGAMGSDYNWLSTYMIMAIPLTLATALAFRDHWIRGVSLGTTGLAVAAELMAFTRGGWFGLIAESVVGLWLAGRRRLLIGFVVVLIALGAGALAVLDFNDRRETSEVTDPWTLRARMDVWKLAAADLLEHPLVGVGYGNYNFVKRYAGRPELEKAYGPHSTFVVIGLGSGLPALACFLWLMGKSFLALTRPIRVGHPVPETPVRMLAFGVAVMLAGYLVRNLFEYMLIGAVANLFWMLIAVGLCVAQESEQGTPTSAKAPDPSTLR